MALKHTVEELKKIMHEIHSDIDRFDIKAAAQRVRKHTLKFAKLAKQYRKESISEHKKLKKAVKKAVAKRKKTAKRRKR